MRSAGAVVVILVADLLLGGCKQVLGVKEPDRTRLRRLHDDELRTSGVRVQRRLGLHQMAYRCA